MKRILKSIVNYLRELSIVIVGITLTVGVGIWVNYNNQKKDLNQYLLAIKLELEENAKMLDLYAGWMQKSIRYAEYLKASDKKNLNKDTLSYYAYTSDDGCGYMNFNSTTYILGMTSAFEMFRNSGAMRQMTDKELLMMIWRAYSGLEGTIRNIDDLFSIKRDEAMKEEALKAEGKSIDVPMRIFYSTDIPYSIQSSCKSTSFLINKTLSKLENITE